MYQDHPYFKSIGDDSKIWRFIDLAKFCDILEKSSLFFVKPEKFTDPWEGYLPHKHFEESSYKDISQDARTHLIKMAKETLPKLVREDMAVNCWHINESESEALWRNYSGRGIAIQSTFGKLKDSLKNNNTYDIFIGKIEYKDHTTDMIDTRNVFNQILWKRKSFDYENELRAVIWQKASKNGDDPISFDNSNGQEIKIDLDLLIDNIYTTPFEKDSWFNSLVENLIKRYGYKFKCQKSKLMEKPF